MNIIRMSLDASILLVVVILVRFLVINKLPRVTFLLLWGIVALKLTIPYSFYSRFDVQSLLHNLFAYFTNVEGSSHIQGAVQGSQTPNPLYSQLLLLMKSDMVLAIWLLGAITVSLFFVVSYVRSYREFQAAVPIKNNAYLNEWLRKHKLKRSIQISVSDRITSPLTYKLFKPVIIFPKSTDWSDEKSIQFVLAHEYVHIKRWDVLWKVLLTAVLALHWFNPLVWVMYFIVNRDMELSCDERVIRRFGEEAKSEYALSLINMAAKTQQISPLCNSFSKNGIEERIVSIMKLKKTSILGVALAGALVVGGITIFATTGQASEVPKENIKQVEKPTNQTINQDVKLQSEEQHSVKINGKEVKGETIEPLLVETTEGDFEISKKGNIITINDASNKEVITESPGDYHLIADTESK
ncbi:M56 family metallopeptidase [Bacillus massiliigorillae]|uniref:M56 family metallopeptidase n=1 Tax=Bacillus massiliigorillae TaxID=1243664 RepID=UPI00039EBFBB|nr:M56 family metallopeptidase [Bacillus massiliigorillae]